MATAHAHTLDGDTHPHTCVRRSSQAAELKAAGVDKVVAVTVGDPTEVQAWAAAQGLDKAALVRRHARGGGRGWGPAAGVWPERRGSSWSGG
jgi:hypothetical protein